ncbi:MULTISPECIES: hypothetical protein [unclassified Sphingomonas]|uniref:hypothetical protein n=1 Tax=Novosphingobium rhizosphaerae TaxID=1551649 RepID=UPI00161C77A2
MAGPLNAPSGQPKIVNTTLSGEITASCQLDAIQAAINRQPTITFSRFPRHSRLRENGEVGGDKGRFSPKLGHFSQLRDASRCLNLMRFIAGATLSQNPTRSHEVTKRSALLVSSCEICWHAEVQIKS